MDVATQSKAGSTSLADFLVAPARQSKPRLAQPRHAGSSQTAGKARMNRLNIAWLITLATVGLAMTAATASAAIRIQTILISASTCLISSQESRGQSLLSMAPQ